MNPVALLPATLFFFSWTLMPAVGHAEPSGPARDSSGIISGLNGQAAAVIPGSGTSRDLRIGDRVAAGEQLRVGSGGTLELLWERRALFTLKERSSVALQQSESGSIFLHILSGTIGVAYSYNEGHPTDNMKIQTPGTTMTLRGGIIEAAVDATGVPDQPRGTESRHIGGAGEMLRVIEGQAYIEPRSSNVKPILLKAGNEWQSLPGRAGYEIRPTSGHGSRDLAAAQSHHQVPAMQRMVQVHVEHALELERAVSKPNRDGNESDGTAGIRGAIVATSLGVPLPTVTGSGATITATSVAPVAPPGVVSGAVPPATPPAVVPPVIAPVIPTPNVTGLTPSQSGGINTLSLLRDVVQDVSRGGNGNGRGRGRDRD